jgi:hypothetical protein
MSDDEGPLQAVCAICRRVLDWDGRTGEWIHGIQDISGGHAPQPVSWEDVDVRGRCDFCSADDPAWVLQTAVVQMAPLGRRGLLPAVAGLSENWACCDLCAEDIRRGRWKQVTMRAVNYWRLFEPDTDPEPTRAGFAALHKVVRKHARGLPQPLDPTTGRPPG